MKSNCPFNWAGSKSVYPELFEIDEPVADLFGGGGGFWSNVKSNDVYVNDALSPLINFQKRVYKSSPEEFDSLVRTLSEKTSKIDSKEKYEELRAEFNATGDDILFMCCLSTCTNNLVRFNKSGGFNQTWGQRRFNQNMEAKLRDFKQRISKKNITFSIGNFYDVDVQDRVIFADPPYLISSAGYNTSWGEENERKLYDFLKGKRFVLTNFLSRGELRNNMLEEFIQNNRLHVNVLKEGQMKAQKDDSTFQEVVVSTMPIEIKKEKMTALF